MSEDLPHKILLKFRTITIRHRGEYVEEIKEDWQQAKAGVDAYLEAIDE